MKNLVRLSAMALLLTACGAKSADYMETPAVLNEVVALSEMAPEEQLAATKAVGTEQQDASVQQVPDKKKIIKTGEMDIKVKAMAPTKLRIDSLVKSFGGYYASENYSDDDYSSTYRLTVQIPCMQYERFIAALESGDGEIQRKAISAQDVTAQFVDMEIRLANKRAYLQRYNELLRKAGTIEEMLEIQQKTRELEEEIESTEGQLRYLNDRVAYSSLTLSLIKAKEYQYTPHARDSFWEQLKDSLSGGWYGFIDVLLAAIAVWPFWIGVGGVIFLFRRMIKRRRDRKKNQETHE